MLARRRLYPILGILFSLGAPGGYLLLRILASRSWPTPGWIRRELEIHADVYSYLVISTAVVFALLGAVLGRQTDLLRERSLTDPLTGLANRRRLEARLREEMRRAARYRSSLSLLLVDLDGLKRLNDRDGHEAGDRALVAVAEALRQSCRAADLPARIGGDEFAVVAPETSGEAARRLAERIRSRLAAATAGEGLSVSIGVVDAAALETDEGADAARLLAMADEALYRAKRAGGDRVATAWDAPPDSSDAAGG